MENSTNNTASNQSNGADEAKPFQPPTGPKFGNKQNKASKPLTATAPAFIPTPASSSAPPNPSKPFNPSAAAFQPSRAPQTSPANPKQQRQQPTKRETSYFPHTVAPGTASPMASRTQSWYGYSSTPAISPMSMLMPMATASPRYSPRNPRRLPMTPGKSTGEQFCQTIVHYHSCGCRAKPTPICSLRRCKHEQPTRVAIGFLPFTCTARWSGNSRNSTPGPEGTPSSAGGRGPACREQDPGTVSFQREEGTASRSTGLRDFNPGTVTLDDLPEALPSDAKGLEGFEAWVEELRVKSEAKEKAMKEEKEGRKKVAVSDMSTQTEWPEEKTEAPRPPQAEMQSMSTQTIWSQTKLHDVGAQTDAPPQPVMKSTGVQWSGPEQKAISVQTDSPPSMTSTGTQSSGPEQKETAVQTPAPPAMKTVGTQSSGPEQREIAVQTSSPPAMTSTGVQPNGPDQKEIAVQTDSLPATTSTGTQPIGLSQKTTAVQTPSPPLMKSTSTQSSGLEQAPTVIIETLCTQWKESDVGVSDGRRRCDEHFLKPYGRPCNYCGAGEDSDSDDYDDEYSVGGRAGRPFDLLLDLDFPRREGEEIYYPNAKTGRHSKTAAAATPASGESRGILRNAWNLIHWVR